MLWGPDLKWAGVSDEGLRERSQGRRRSAGSTFFLTERRLSSVPGGVAGEVSTLLSPILSGSKEEPVQLSSRSVQVHEAGAIAYVSSIALGHK